MANNKNNARLPNWSPLVQLGIDPKTKLPKKLVDAELGRFKEGMKALLRIIDEQDSVTRFTWYNLPCNITSQELERMLYYKGQLCMFYFEPLDQFFFMPYTLTSDSGIGTGLDFYGRYRTISPIPFVNGTAAETKSQYKAQMEVLSGIKLNVIYDIPLEPVDPYHSAVLVHDYTKQLSQNIIPRQILNDPLLDVMAECMPLMRTSLFNSSGVLAMRVNSQDEQSNVRAANESIDMAALNGQRYIPVLGQIDFQELAAGETAKAEEFLMAMQSLDNFRLSTHGLDNGGLFQKKSHVLQSESDMNAGHASSALDDGLMIRQHMCDIANAIWGIGMSVEVSESALSVDMNGDMLAVDNQDQSGIPGQQPQGVSQNYDM